MSDRRGWQGHARRTGSSRMERNGDYRSQASCTRWSQPLGSPESPAARARRRECWRHLAVWLRSAPRRSGLRCLERDVAGSGTGGCRNGTAPRRRPRRGWPTDTTSRHTVSLSDRHASDLCGPRGPSSKVGNRRGPAQDLFNGDRDCFWLTTQRFELIGLVEEGQ